MLKPISYPKCVRSFLEFNQNNNILPNQSYSKFFRVRPFDVTLRDGLQGLTIDEQTNYTTEFKKQIYREIIEKYNPRNIEIGSCVNTKILPIFKDTEDLFKMLDYNLDGVVELNDLSLYAKKFSNNANIAAQSHLFLITQ
jgi:hypothetical protein